MSDLWKEVTTWLTEATRSAVKETEDLARRGRWKMEVLGINTALNDKFTALGGVVYEIIRKDSRIHIKKDPKVLKLVKEIAELEIRLHATKKEDKDGSKSSRKPAKPSSASQGRKSNKAASSSKKAPSSRNGKPSAATRSSQGKPSSSNRNYQKSRS